MPKDDRKARILERAEREKVKFMRLQFTDILGAIKNVEVPDRQFDEALDGRIMFDGSSIEGFVRIEESDMYLKPDLNTFQVFPWSYAGSERVGRIICDIANPDGTAVRRLPAVDAEARDRARRREGFRDAGGTGGGVLPVSAPRNGEPTTETHDSGGYFDLTPVDLGEDVRREIIAGARADGISRRGRASRGRAGPARDRFPPRRRADDGRQRQHVPLRRQERREPQRPARDLHAEADLRHQRQRHAHAPGAVCGQQEPVLRCGRRVAAQSHVPALHRRPAAPREELLRDHQPARELVQAARARLRGADGHRLVGTQSQPAHSRAGRARREHAGRAADAGSVVQSRTSRSR